MSFDSFDPGITRTVGLIQSWGFKTTDSGDGVSKFKDGVPLMEEALDFPHVVIRVMDPPLLVAEARRLRSLLEEWGVPVSEEGSGSSWIEASYSPVDDVAFIFLGGLDDNLLP